MEQLSSGHGDVDQPEQKLPKHTSWVTSHSHDESGNDIIVTQFTRGEDASQLSGDSSAEIAKKKAKILPHGGPGGINRPK